MVPILCEKLGSGSLDAWEYGNEPEAYIITKNRPDSWDVTEFVSEWQSGATYLESLIKASCPDLNTGFMGPAISNVNGGLPFDVTQAFQHDLDKSHNLKQIVHHQYVFPGAVLLSAY